MPGCKSEVTNRNSWAYAVSMKTSSVSWNSRYVSHVSAVSSGRVLNPLKGSADSYAAGTQEMMEKPRIWSNTCCRLLTRSGDLSLGRTVRAALQSFIEVRAGYGRSICFLQRRTFVHRDVVGLVALDFILRLFLARVVCLAFVINIFRVHRDDLASDVASFRIPFHVIADLECSRHVGLPAGLILPQHGAFK